MSTDRSTELCLQSATALADLIRRREVSAVEVLENHLEQIDAVNSLVNAIVTLVPDHARNLARRIDKQLAQGEDPGILAGLPTAHKDLVDTKGIRTTYGSRIHANHVPDQDALIVKRMVDAGAVTLGKTNTPEFGAGSQTFNEVFGSTLNPYDTTKTCGGSSGGAAVALATRMLPIADGSDLGGSLRNPANFCNVVGFRTTAGRVPSSMPLSSFPLPVLGPMARTVEDCALLLTAIAGPSIEAPLSMPFSPADFTASLQRDFKGVRVAISPDFAGQLPVEASVRQVVEQSASALTAIGCNMDDGCPDFAGADDVFKTLRAWSTANAQRDNINRHRELMKDTLIWNVEQGLGLTGEDVYQAEVKRTEVSARVNAFMQEYEFLILPVSQVPPFDTTQEYVEEIAGEKMHTYIDWMKSCYYVTVTGLPAISVPGGFTPSGLPVGIQIVGRSNQDLAVLQLAKAFQDATNYWQRLPGVNTV